MHIKTSRHQYLHAPHAVKSCSSVVLVFCFSEIFLCVLGVQLILQ